MVIVQEPHKKWTPGRAARAQHYHCVFKMAHPFAHSRLNNSLGALGAKGFFTFHRTGWAAYLSYVLQPSAKKLLKDLDSDPLFWPDSFDKAAAIKVIENVSAQQAARVGNEDLQRQKKATGTEDAEL